MLSLCLATSENVDSQSLAKKIKKRKIECLPGK